MLVIAWAGWSDAGESASAAARYLIGEHNAEPFARIDPEEYYDFTEARPLARYRHGEREIVWPSTDFFAIPNARGPHDLIVGVGIEPHQRWKGYLGALHELAQTMDVRLALSLAAVAGGIHTRPVNVTGSANTPELAERFGMPAPRYEGPTGIVGVFHDDCRRHAIDGVSFWASVPHYIPGMTNPVGSRALLESVETVVDVQIDYSGLNEQIDRFTEQMKKAMAENEELREYVQRLEEMAGDEPAQAAQAQAAEGASELPSADVLIEDLEDFLRQRQEGD